MALTYFLLKKLKRKRSARRLSLAGNGEIGEQLINGMKIATDIGSNDFSTCRICLKEARIPIFGNEEYKDLSEDVRRFGDIVLSKEDAFPKHLCDACLGLLQGAILFRKSAKETENSLQKSLSVEIFSDNQVNNETLSAEEGLEGSTDETEFPIQAVKTYNCKLCKKYFETNDEYARHRSSREHKNVRVQCPICNRLLTTQLYKKHLLRHQTASHLVCDVCGKLYRKDNLVRHLQLHSFDLPFQCQLCPYRGRFMESLRIHMRTHTGDKPFSCEKCHLRFLTRSNLNRHLLTHKKERPFKCIECGRGFYTKSDMAVHFKSDHVGIKDFCCRMCGSKYGTRKALMRHELRVHKRNKMAKGRVPLYLQSEYRGESGTV